MMRFCSISLFSVGVLVGLMTNCGMSADGPGDWKVGIATVNITPRESMWMAGYASRTKPSDGVLTELRAKALAIEDAAGTRAVIVTTDLISIPRMLREQVSGVVAEKFKLDPAGLLLNCSHTHCSPVVKDDLELSVMYRLELEQRKRVEGYFVELRDKLVAAIGAAIAELKPAKLGYSHARCGFAMNRRLPVKGEFQNSPYPNGPVDQDVPVLRVESPDGKLLAVAFGYACHNTTTALQQFNADYAGYAQLEIEKQHPGVTALFVMGCGGDQNPYPRGKIEWAMTHGNSLAAAVEAALLPEPQPLRGPLKVGWEAIDLEFAPVTRNDLLKRLESKDVYEQRGGGAPQGSGAAGQGSRDLQLSDSGHPVRRRPDAGRLGRGSCCGLFPATQAGTGEHARVGRRLQQRCLCLYSVQTSSAGGWLRRGRGNAIRVSAWPVSTQCRREDCHSGKRDGDPPAKRNREARRQTVTGFVCSWFDS